MVKVRAEHAPDPGLVSAPQVPQACWGNLGTLALQRVSSIASWACD